MKRFEIHGTFEAEDIDDALSRLAEHFTRLVSDDDDDPVAVLGISEIRVSRVSES